MSHSSVIGRDTRTAIQDQHPLLAEPRLRRLFDWKLFGDHVHVNESDHGRVYQRVAIPASRLAEIEGEERRFAQKRYVGRSFLDEYAQTMPGFAYTGWQPGKHYRQIDHDGLDEPTLDLMMRDLLRPVSDLGPAVDLWTDQTVEGPYSGRGAVRRRIRASEAAARAEERLGGSLCEEQRLLLGVLNTTPSNDISALVRRNAQAALDVASTVVAKPGVDSRLRHGLRTMMDVRRVQYQPMAFYVPSPHLRTVRVHPVVYPAVVTLRRQAREQVFSGCLAVDVKNCQLACAAASWQVGPLLDHLTREGTAWPHLLGLVRERHGLSEAEAKHVLKRAVYATVFGMGKRGVRFLLGHALSFDAASAFLNDPIIVALFERRDEALARIEAMGGARDCFGVWYGFRSGQDREEECRSVLAATMQARELQLLLPVVEDAARTATFERPQYRIVGWLHDGFYLKVRTDADGVARRLAGAVQREADRLGIPTSLDVERL